MTTEELDRLATASRIANATLAEVAISVANYAAAGLMSLDAFERRLDEYRAAWDAWNNASAAHLAAYEEWKAGGERIAIALAEASSIDAVHRAGADQ